MPIYEYHCKKCDKDFEYLVFRKNEKVHCPECNGKNVKRLMSACGYTSKGSDGQTASSQATGSSCGGCAASSCAGCGH